MKNHLLRRTPVKRTNIVHPAIEIIITTKTHQFIHQIEIGTAIEVAIGTQPIQVVMVPLVHLILVAAAAIRRALVTEVVC